MTLLDSDWPTPLSINIPSNWNVDVQLLRLLVEVADEQGTVLRCLLDKMPATLRCLLVVLLAVKIDPAVVFQNTCKI